MHMKIISFPFILLSSLWHTRPIYGALWQNNDVNDSILTCYFFKLFYSQYAKNFGVFFSFVTLFSIAYSPGELILIMMKILFSQKIWKAKKYYNVYGAIPKYNRKNSQREVNLYPYTHFHDLSLFWLGINFLAWYRHFNSKWRFKVSFLGGSNFPS